MGDSENRKLQARCTPGSSENTKKKATQGCHVWELLLAFLTTYNVIKALLLENINSRVPCALFPHYRELHSMLWHSQKNQKHPELISCGLWDKREECFRNTMLKKICLITQVTHNKISIFYKLLHKTRQSKWNQNVSRFQGYKFFFKISYNTYYLIPSKVSLEDTYQFKN